MARILIVDDDPDLVETVGMMLEAKGYETLAAYGGVEGLAKAKSDRPDLIVLDVMMPDKDGFAVCEELKADPEYEDIPIVLLTAIGQKVSTTRYSHSGGKATSADDFFEKPVKPDELVAQIERLLG